MDTDLKEAVELRNHDGIFILYLNTAENRFNPTSINLIHDALDVVEKHRGATALISVSTSPKIYSNGVDLDWVRENPEKGMQLFSDFIRLLGRFQVIGCPTVAAIGGHAFAGGCMFALAHDYRVMSKGKGFICLPEIDLGMHLPPGMTLTCQVKLTPTTYTDLMIGKRFTPEACETAGIVNKAVEKSTLFEHAYLLANENKSRGSNKEKLKMIKYMAYKESYEACRSGELDVTVEPVLRAKM